MIGIKRAFSMQADVKQRGSPQSLFGGPGVSTSEAMDSLWRDNTLGLTLSYDQMLWIYLHNVWVRCCVDKITRRVAAVEPVVKALVPYGKSRASRASMRRADEVQKFLDNPNAYFENFSTMRSKIVKDLLIYDAAALEIVRSEGKENNNIYQLVTVSGPTIRFNKDKKTGKIPWESSYAQVVGGKKVAEFSYNELIYFVLNPRSGCLGGLSPLETLKTTVAADLYTANYNLDFFANDATPKFMLLFNNVGSTEEEIATKMARWRDYFDQELRGNPHRPLLAANENGTLDMRMFSMQQADMQFQEYSYWLLTKIMAVYGVQPFVMGIILPTTGRLNSEQQDEAFKEDAIKPQLKIFADAINQYIIWDENGFGYDDVYLDYYGMDLVDENIQSQVDERYLKTYVITINDVRDELGKPRVSWGERPLVKGSFAPLPDTLEEIAEKKASGVKTARKDYEEEDGTIERDDKTKPIIPSSLSPMEARMLRRRNGFPTGLTLAEEKEGIKRITRRIAGRRKYVLLGGVNSTPVR